MSAPKHTPGPWVKMSDIPEYDWVISRSEDASPGNIVCVAPPTDCPKSLENWPANRALICAAPDLMEALKQALGRMLHVEDYKDGAKLSLPACSAAIASATAAIAKAEGRPA